MSRRKDRSDIRKEFNPEVLYADLDELSWLELTNENESRIRASGRFQELPGLRKMFTYWRRMPRGKREKARHVAFAIRTDRAGAPRGVAIYVDGRRSPVGAQVFREIELEAFSDKFEAVIVKNENLFDRRHLHRAKHRRWFDLTVPEIVEDLRGDPLWAAGLAMLEELPQERQDEITHAALDIERAQDGRDYAVVFAGYPRNESMYQCTQTLSFDHQEWLPEAGSGKVQ